MVVVATAVIVLAGCSAGGTDTDTAGTSASPSQVPPPAALALSRGAPPPALSPPAPTGRVAGGKGASSQEQKLPFVADARPDVSTPHAGYPVLVSVVKASRVGYDRYVFEFTNDDPEGDAPLAARPAWDVRHVSPRDVVMDGSGSTVSVGGASVLRIQFKGAAMHWEDGRSSLKRSVPDDDALSFGGDFEGQVTWFLGREQKSPFRTVFLGQGRVAVDVVR